MFDFTVIWKAFAEIPTAGALSVRLDFLKDHLQRAEARIKELEAENASLTKQLHEANKEAVTNPVSQELVKHAGALWERLPTGGYADYPMCPHCRVTMSSFQNVIPFRCHKCRYLTNFNGRELVGVRSKLPS
jgi:hypothetical protein